MSSLLLLNGSPRGARSNSMRMLTQVAVGWKAAGGGEPIVLHLAKRADFERAVAEFASADTVMLGMPLYADSMPSLVAGYFEALEPRVGLTVNPTLAFLVQSGFVEALHSRGLERYLTKLSARLGSAYGGTIVRGGGEALQSMPDTALGKLFGRLQSLGGQLERDGRFAAATLAEIAGIERFSPLVAAVLSLVLKAVSPLQWRDLKKNGVWKDRFDAPYARAAR